MGHYYSATTRIRVKAEAPAELFEILDAVFTWTPESIRACPEGWHWLKLSLGNNAAYMPEKEPTKQAIEGGWLYSHAGSTKNDPEEELIKLLRKYREWFMADKYEIVCRAVYESSMSETAVYFNGLTFVAGTGFVYENPDDVTGCRKHVDHLHPYFADNDCDGFEECGNDTLPWNYKEILLLNVKSGRKKKWDITAVWLRA